MKMIHHILRLLSAILVLLIFNQPLLAEEKPIGLIVALRGEVTAVNTAGAQRRLAVKNEIYLADTIKTGGRGRVQMMFDDNTLISLGPNTDMQIAEYQWNPDKKTGAMKTRVNEGVFRIMGGAITQVAPRNFKTETPAGTIGIRGSMYAGKVSGSSLHVLFQGGKGIYVSNDAGTVSIDRPGFGTFVAGPSAPPAAPTRLSSEDMTQLEDVAVDVPADADEGDGTGQGTDSQIPADSSSEPGGSEDEQPVQEQEVLEAFDEPAADGEAPLLGGASTTSNLQAAAIVSPVDSVKNAVSEAVIDSIETVRQEKVLEIEQAILDLLQELGFAGDRSLSVPNNGIEAFDGVVRHKTSTSPEYSEDPVKMAINWHNNKFFGVIENENQTEMHFPVFIFGDVKDTALDNIRVIGSGADPDVNRVTTIDGTGIFGQLYGSETDATGFAMQGVDVDVANQSDRQDWTAYGATISKGEPLPGASAPGGTHNLKGFVMGIAEDMAAPHLNRRIFMNDMATDFQLSVDKDAGSIIGQLSADDYNLSGSTIAGLQIGGPLGSAYVLDDAMIALLGGENSIMSGPSTGGLKEFGNYLVTEKQPDQLAPYTTWGYWEIAYRDPETGTDYHVHQPGSYWIAGPQTPASEVNSLMSANFMGTYTGGAEGIQIDTTGRISELTGGATNLTIDFNPSATMPVMGNISFDQVNLNMLSNPGDVNPNGFSGLVNGAITSKVKGTFFGPNAAAIGGNFGAKMSTGEGYHGIFAGSR
jgi:hypothetical protein